ncbi:MAG: helix-turn-helix domain-containing protein [Bacteroidetes bacterium]|nr:helix-turn-helix domain-containing protein [Bacteroidota bacterium]
MKNYNIPLREAAKFLGITAETLRNYNVKKKISYKIIGNKAFYNKEDLDEYLQTTSKIIERA